MHIEWAADMVVEMEKRGAINKAVEYAVDDEVLLRLVDKVGGEKQRSIAQTIRKSSGYKRVTEKQRYAIARFLIDHYGDTPAVFAAAYGTNVKSFMAHAGQ